MIASTDSLLLDRGLGRDLIGLPPSLRWDPVF
jgi:hypothetical protein